MPGSHRGSAPRVWTISTTELAPKLGSGRRPPLPRLCPDAFQRLLALLSDRSAPDDPQRIENDYDESKAE
jgi:hypothetical protein